MSRFVSCYSLVASLRLQTMVARPFALLASSNSTSTERQRLTNVPGSSRSLYTDSALGISKLDKLREQKNQLFTGLSRDRYVERLSEYLKKGDVESIYKDDLVNLIGIANGESDLNLIEEIISNPASRSAAFYQGWGALLVRLYYKMNELDRAYNNIKDFERFGDFFNLRSCYKVLMTMLYDAKRYDLVLEIFDLSHERLKTSDKQDQGEDDSGVERDLSALAFAALARINNQDTLKQAEELYNKLTKNSRAIGLRPASFFAYIACSNDQPKLALNLISNTPNRNYISLRELKIVSLIKLGRYEDILLQLREYVANIKRESNLLLKSTYEMIRENINKIEDEVVRQELNDLLIEIKDSGHVSETTIEELLFKQIDQERPPVRLNQGYRPPRYNDRNGNYSNNNYNYNNDRYQGDRYQSRPPRSPYNQSNNQQRPFRNRRYNEEQDEEHDDNQTYGSRGDDRRRQKKFTYQNVNFD